MALAKLTIVVGAGLVGSSILTNDGNFPDLTHLFTGAFRLVTRNLRQENNNSRLTSKSQTDTLLAQVNSLREELEKLASTGAVTIVTNAGSGYGRYGLATVIVVGTLGYMFIWWKGWKLSDMMFVTRRGFSDVCNQVGKQVDAVSSSVTAAKRQLSSRIECVNSNLDECMELAVATKSDVSQLNGDISSIYTDVESVHRAVQTLETKIIRIEGTQDYTTKGIYHLCEFVKRSEEARTKELIKDSPSSSHRAIELPQTSSVVARAASLPPLSVESASLPVLSSSEASPSTALVSPKVLRPSTAVSAAGLKELQEISNLTRLGSMKSNIMLEGTSKASKGITEERKVTAPSSAWSAWKFPGVNILSRSRSNAT
ncbi:hypothetical protein Cni_G06151 [Canna indica]|uniref:DUF1664 domain-containing protein n=1 Tax=Canna indica TaxID=4628 RepID=A0AAQ3JWI5_9LILI|nr:hypothetical protein Cni_G06151 [Canna indica]